jgi:hypothetical protein
MKSGNGGKTDIAEPPTSALKRRQIRAQASDAGKTK